MTEQWKAVPFAPTYEVSSEGRVRSLDRVGVDGRKLKGKILSLKETPQGYFEASLRYGGKMHFHRVNRLVCLVFNGEPSSDDLLACHKDDDPKNNTPNNLYWGTRADNAKDALRNDRYSRGEACGSSRHSVETIQEIRRVHSETGLSMRELSRRFGVSKAQVNKIINRQCWTHI